IPRPIMKFRRSPAAPIELRIVDDKLVASALMDINEAYRVLIDQPHRWVRHPSADIGVEQIVEPPRHRPVARRSQVRAGGEKLDEIGWRIAPAVLDYVEIVAGPAGDIGGPASWAVGI